MKTETLLKTRTDARLLALAASGDHRAFEELFDRHSPAVFRYAWGLADQRQDVDDLVQETFFVAWKRRHSILIAGDSVLPWLLVSCRNLAFNLNRKRRRDEAEELPATLIHEESTAPDDLEWVLDEINKLGDVDRRLCQLCLIEGHDYDTAAAQLGISTTGARKRIQRIRAGLRRARAHTEKE